MIIRKFLPLQAQLKRLKHFQTSLLRSALVGVLLVAVASQAQMAKNANKFVGNITTRNAVRSDFLTWWNQITPENESKWATVEGTRDVMNWGGVDNVKNFAETNKIPWKFHTLVWGSQYPGWITGLSQADQLAEINEWFDAAHTRYPNVNMIDVVNEAYEANGGKHAPPPFKAALGGTGTSGYDWIANSFKMARQRWPKAILIYNDYNIIEWANEVNWTPTMINAIKKAGAPVDAIGAQAHDAYRIAPATLKSNIDKLAATGLPVFITEFDIPDPTDASQLTTMQNVFPVFWNHPKVVGITYWGYLVGATWKNGTGLLNTNGTERPALTWLKNYIASNPNPPNDFPNFVKGGVGIVPHSSSTLQGPVTRKGPGLMEIFDLQGKMVKSIHVNDRTITASMMPSPGSYVVKLDGTYAGIFAKVR
jgi:endo-1,4-beta-xylanase